MSSTFAVCSHCKSINKVNIEQARSKSATCGKCGDPLELQGLTSQVNEKDLERILKLSDKPVIVDFWAPWCGPCKMYGPEFVKASTEIHQAVFLKVNIDDNQSLSSKLGIRGVPCTVFFKNGLEVKRQSGAMSSAQLSSLVSHI